MKKLKLYFVRRWLHLLTDQELNDFMVRRQFDDFHGKLAKQMIDNYFTGVEGD